MNTTKINYKVTIHCPTFNHAHYIRQSLDGFVMQKTNFPFAAIVVDDASTDNEQEVLWDFINNELDPSSLQKDETEDYVRVIATHKTNHNCTFAFLFLKYNHYNIKKDKRIYLKPWEDKTKYIAICEGDDYWIDPLKLQKQVDYLDNNTEYLLTFHRAMIFRCIPNETSLKCTNIEDRDYSATEIFENWLIPTASVVFRKEAYDYMIKGAERKLNGDIFLMESCAHLGKVRGMSDFMSVYRVHAGGVTYDKSKYVQRRMKYPMHFECIEENFPKIDRKIISNRIAESYWERSHYQKSTKLKLKDKFSAIKRGGAKLMKRHIKLYLKSFLR